jgi:triphosphoribosyl-dephospho-CoA synthase
MAVASACLRNKNSFVEGLGRLAMECLIAEAQLTPKPGLVDRRGSGAHMDLSLDLMLRSAFAIEPYFRQMSQVSLVSQSTPELFQELKKIGRSAEQAMFSATNGSNAHKGAIWSLGLLVAAAAIHGTSSATAFAVADTAAGIAAFNNAAVEQVTHGYIVQQRFAILGAKAEAQQGFPHVINVALPVLRRRRAEGADENSARIDCLLTLIGALDDTCLLYRGGRAGLAIAQTGARAVLEAGGFATKCGRQKLLELDQKLVAMHLSPGGSADLLAATLFLDAVERES